MFGQVVKKEEKHAEIKRMLDFNNVSYYTGFHKEKDTFFEPQFNLDGSFSEYTMQKNRFMMALKVCLITGASAGFGIAMGFVMSSFEFNQQRIIDTNRSSSSQLKQHFHGYTRFLKRQALHFARFGLYISLLEIPMELIFGRVNSPAIFLSGGGAAMLQTRYTTPAAAFSSFMGSGMFIGGLGLYMHSGHD